MKYIVLPFLCACLSCREHHCASCIAQYIESKEIQNHAIECDDSEAFVEGFVDGFENSYAERLDSIQVICNYD